ncbi:hypothetical protein QN277_028221 [Acacia crassicarpa]|uniref:Subtilisin-like protease fibronectin type-III domain-containing protein n=1 Tax=Acacia crassicarpa TaxID=499986 RepID=A0AAE1MEX1_9FABA|nr:hypothetical protein QN277_028221 [Acacia crassicarpa]
MTNVGPANSTYSLELKAPPALSKSVYPTRIRFSEVNQKATFLVEFIPQKEENIGNHSFVQGSVSGFSKRHTVRLLTSVVFAS